ncbi:hypothetical protein [Streptomyces sp. NBC_01320]|uniref:hypothetical protein n=1 Tax=Streptomyces sp. NBC_01320 TaxID=2903824 RepID=UPI002E0EFDC3|nr:hypothetical protein OG395_42990 [Streptomyces sp. NBC_01320]
MLADAILQIRLGGDLALFQALNRLLPETEDAAEGTVLDRAFIASYAMLRAPQGICCCRPCAPTTGGSPFRPRTTTAVAACKAPGASYS